MYDEILAQLRACEQQHGVKVLLAIESGSRSWGFASTNSDYDVRFVYVRPKDDYLRLEKVRDTIDWILDEELDIVGWDLGKFLRLLRNSNPSTFEWLESDIIYMEDSSFGSVRSLARRCVSPISLANHYLGMTTSNAHMLEKSEPTLKRYLYVTRALLSCKWVIEQQANPPIVFDTLCERELRADLKPIIEDMVEKKRAGTGSSSMGHVHELDAWIHDELQSLTDAIRQLEKTQKPSWQEVDKVFLQLVH